MYRSFSSNRVAGIVTVLYNPSLPTLEWEGGKPGQDCSPLALLGVLDGRNACGPWRMHPTADLDAAAVSHLPCVCHGIQLSVVRVVAGRRGFPAPRRAESNGRFGLLFLLLALRDQSLGEACQVVVDRVGGLLWRRRGVHARAQSLLDRRAAPPVVTGRRPASCGRGRGGGKEKVGCQPSCLSRATKTTGGRGPFDLGIGIPNTEDMTVRQGFGTGRSGWRTRSTRSGGSRIGLRFVILSWVEGSWSCGSACCVAATSLWHRGGEGRLSVARPSRLLAPG